MTARASGLVKKTHFYNPQRFFWETYEKLGLTRSDFWRNSPVKQKPEAVVALVVAFLLRCHQYTSQFIRSLSAV